MVIMENYYHPQDRLDILWQSIEKCHLSYLEMEESQAKIAQRNKLEEYIHDYLCINPHSQKFTFRETGEVLQRSATSKKDFSGYKAATGFNAVQLYAANLLSQPWRKEYRYIKTYCGFYMHQIEANLVGAEMMFEAMGYKHTGDGMLQLDGPICPDRVAAVSKDCLLAYVECQIMKTIWEGLSSSFKVTWLEVLDFRKTHLGDAQQAIKSIEYRQNQRQYQEHTRSYSHGNDQFSGTRCQPINIPVPSTSPVVPVNQSFPPLSSHHHVGLPPAIPQPLQQQYIYGNGFCPNNYPYNSTYAYMPYNQPTMKPQFNTNGYFYTNGYVVPPQMQVPAPYNYPVPTGQLIELEQHNGGYDVVDKPSHKSRHSECVNNDLYRSKNNNITKVTLERESDKDDSQFEDWDYVYRNLESQGYSKDLGERGDVLSPSSQRLAREGKKVKATNLDEALNNMTVSDRPLKMTQTPRNIDREKKKLPPEIIRIEKQISPRSSYENIAEDEIVTKPVPKPSTSVSYAKTKSLPREKIVTVHSEKPMQTKTLDVRKPPKEEKVIRVIEAATQVESKPSAGKWQCKSCTYLNEGSKDICEMCSKSRIIPPDPHMEIGGAECSKCTLVNPKNLKKCEACGNSLKDSPTYI